MAMSFTNSRTASYWLKRNCSSAGRRRPARPSTTYNPMLVREASCSWLDKRTQLFTPEKGSEIRKPLPFDRLTGNLSKCFPNSSTKTFGAYWRSRVFLSAVTITRVRHLLARVPLRAFRASGMRVAWTGIAVFSRQLQTRLDAACRPWPRRISGRIAYFHAESVALRFRAVAIADADTLRPQFGRRICANDEGTAEEAQEQARGSYKPGRIWARPVPTRSSHQRILQLFLHKNR
jgi:hypothetical protein